MEYNLVIQMENGQPVNHPIMMANFLQCFPNIDVNNLPDNFQYFVRHDRPTPTTPYHVVSEEPVYVVRDGYVEDVWDISELTPEEKQNKINEAMTSEHPASWTFDIDKCQYVPPVAYPDDGNNYYWDENTVSWQQRQ